MMTRLIRSIIITVSFVLSLQTLFAGGVYDVFANKYYEYVLRSKDVIPEVKYFKTEVDVTYFEMVNTDDVILKNINDKMFNLTSSYIKDNTKALDLYTELRERTKVYTEIENSQNTNYQYRNNYTSEPVLVLTDIESNAVSMVAGKMFFEITFEFRIPSSNSRYDNELLITHYYIADLSTGTIERWRNTLNPSELIAIQDKLSKRINETYNLVTSKLDISDLALIDIEDEEDEEGNPVKKQEVCKDICTRIDLKEADFYWFAWGMMIRFQSFTYSSKIFYGSSFSLFIPFEEAVTTFAAVPQFYFINQITPPSTLISNFNPWQYIMEIGEVRRAPEIDQLLKLNQLNKIPKTLVIERHQLFENGKSNFQNKAYYDFNPDGQMLSKRVVNEKGKTYNSEFFSYDNEGNLLEIIKRNYRDEESSETFSYDSRKNLVSMKNIGDDEISEYLYYYNGNYIYRFDMTNLLEPDQSQLQRYSAKNRKFCFTNMCYVLDEQGRVKGIKSGKYVYQQGQIGRDKQGRIVESHFERDRYNYYWNYDSINRLTSWQMYEYENPKREFKYFYDQGSTFPFRRLDTRSSYSNKTILEELYEWKFF
jgi:hypothetical protein